MKICILPGDGIGREVIPEAVRVLESFNLGFDFIYEEIGFETFQKTGKSVPEETLDKVKESDATLFGAITNPPYVKNYSSPILQLRKHFQLYANIRPCKNENVNLIVIRENTECLYSGVERVEDDGNTAITERIITRKASERIARYAFEYAEKNNYNKVHAVHKANILRKSDGLFLESVEQIAKNYPNISLERIIVDNCALQLIKNPQQFQVIVAPNLYGDILSDLSSYHIGGLGVAYSGNIGETTAIFEPVHGSAPDIVGKEIANPVAAILSAKFMLEHLGFDEEAERIENSVNKSIKDGMTTPDLRGALKTQEVTDYIIRGLTK